MTINDEIRKNCLKANVSLVSRGMVFQNFGNAGLIEDDFLYIKPSGVNLSDASLNDISVVNLNTGQLVSGKKQSSDTPTYLEILRKFPQIKGLVHTHSQYATAWAQAGLPIPCYGTTHADYCNGYVPITRPLSDIEIETEYETNTGKVIVETLSERGVPVLFIPGILVINHGVFAWGDTIEEAINNAERIEHIAKLAFITKNINKDVNPISRALQNKHFNRKHGTDAYYGQLDE